MEASITERLKALQQMTVAGLQAEYEKLLGRPTKSRNKKQLFKQLARRIQADAAGSKTETAKDAVPKPTLTVKFERKGKAKAAGKAKKAAKAKAAKSPAQRGRRDGRLPQPGTIIERVYKGRKLLVRVSEQGFEFEGKPYRSLSAIAKAVTGSIWNGYLFFGLVPRKGKRG